MASEAWLSRESERERGVAVGSRSQGQGLQRGGRRPPRAGGGRPAPVPRGPQLEFPIIKVSVAPRPFFSPAEKLFPNPPSRCPDRASSPEIIATSTDAAALCMRRRTAHERYLGRRRSSQSEELTTDGASPRRGAHPKMTDETRDRASSPEIIATSPYAPAGGMA
eukprot:scaffold21772_cov64-Phaeocystis_antarctica.AAC.1